MRTYEPEVSSLVLAGDVARAESNEPHEGGSTATRPGEPTPRHPRQKAMKGGRNGRPSPSAKGALPMPAGTSEREQFEHGGWCWSLSWLDAECNTIPGIEAEVLRLKAQFWTGLGSPLIWRTITYRDPQQAALQAAAA